MRVLVIGGTGFIGPYVVRRLHAAGHDVAIYHRGHAESELPPAVRHLHGERAELASHRDALSAFAPEVALDMYAMTEADARLVNQALRGVASRLVAMTSQDVYRAYGRLIGTEPGPPDTVPLSEDAPLRERLYPYRGETPRDEGDPQCWMDDYDKIAVERVVMHDPALPGTVLRLPMVYGPGDPQHRLHESLKRMDDGRPTMLLSQRAAEWRWTRGYVENVADAIALAVMDARAASRVYNVGEPEALPLAGWVREIGQAAGWRGEIRALPDEQLPPHLRAKGDFAQDLVADSSRIRSELGYAEAIPRDEALRRTAAWERAHPPATSDAAEFDYAAEDATLSEFASETLDSVGGARKDG